MKKVSENKNKIPMEKTIDQFLYRNSVFVLVEMLVFSLFP
jgi:hypothetical protein